MACNPLPDPKLLKKAIATCWVAFVLLLLWEIIDHVA